MPCYSAFKIVKTYIVAENAYRRAVETSFIGFEMIMALIEKIEPYFAAVIYVVAEKIFGVRPINSFSERLY